MPNPVLYIASVNRSNKTATNSVSIRRSLNQRWSLTAELFERQGVYRPVPGNVIEIGEGSPEVLRFAGYIEDIEEQAVPGNLGAIAYRITAVDYTRLLDWRLYSGSFENVSFYSIVEAIYNAKLSGDGVSLAGVVNPGPTISTRIQDGLRPVTEWFRKLSTETGFQFYIDPYKVLHFGPLATSPPNPAPFGLTFGSLNWRKLKIRRRMGDLRNRQYVRTEYNVTGTLTKQFVGDGVTRDFPQYDGAFDGVPTATVDTGSGPVAVTVKRLGFDPYTPGEWYYDFEGWGFHNLAPDAPLGVGDILEITYRVRFNSTAVLQDSAAIAARAAIQGDSGLIEALHEDRYIDRPASLIARATALLRQYGTIGIEIDTEFDSRIEPLSDELEPGMLMPINLTDGPSDVNDDFTVESIESNWIAGAPEDKWEHRVHLTNVEPWGATSSSREPTIAVMERIAEAIRIGPDIETVASESPSEATEHTDWSATIVDKRNPMTVGTDLSNHRPVDVDEGEKVELDDWYATLKVNTGAIVEVDALRSRDDGATFASIYPPGGKPTFGSGVKYIDGSTFAIPELYHGERLTYAVNIVSGDASGFTLVLKGRRVPDNSPA